MSSSEREQLELGLIELFSKCTAFGFSFGHTVTKEDFAQMLNDGDSIDHQQAAHDAMQLIDTYVENREREARIHELESLGPYRKLISRNRREGTELRAVFAGRINERIAELQDSLKTKQEFKE